MPDEETIGKLRALRTEMRHLQAGLDDIAHCLEHVAAISTTLASLERRAVEMLDALTERQPA